MGAACAEAGGEPWGLTGRLRERARGGAHRAPWRGCAVGWRVPGKTPRRTAGSLSDARSGSGAAPCWSGGGRSAPELPGAALGARRGLPLRRREEVGGNGSGVPSGSGGRAGCLPGHAGSCSFRGLGGRAAAWLSGAAQSPRPPESDQVRLGSVAGFAWFSAGFPLRPLPDQPCGRASRARAPCFAWGSPAFARRRRRRPRRFVILVSPCPG